MQVNDCTQAASDQSLDFSRAAVDLAAAVTSFSWARAAWQHVVFGGHPAFASPFHPRGNAGFNRCRAKHDRFTAFVKNAGGGGFQVPTFDFDGADLIVRAGEIGG